MRIGQLLNELKKKEFQNPREMMDWLTKRGEQLMGRFRSPRPQEESLLAIFKMIRDHVNWSCDFGDRSHQREDQCRFCEKSVCQEHSKRFTFYGTFWSVCRDCIGKATPEEIEKMKNDSKQLHQEEVIPA